MSITVQYLGHSAVRLKTEKGTEILIDPWLGNPTAPKNWSPAKIDLICLTHGHSDHVGETIALAKHHKATVAATFELGQLLVKDGLSSAQLQPMNKGGAILLQNLGGIRVALTNAFHSSSYDAADGTVHYAGEAAGVVITLESGRTVYHAGDTCLFSDMRLIKERFKPFLAFLPIGDRFTMGPEDAAIAAELIAPERVVPIHHSTFDMLSGTPVQFKDEVAKRKLKIDVEVLAPGAELKL